MSDLLGDRGRALENDYFRRKEQEALARLREQSERARTRGASDGEVQTAAALRCPRDGGEMVAVMMDGVQIDRCPACGGLWLDAGELEQLTDRDQRQGFFHRMRRTIVGE